MARKRKIKAKQQQKVKKPLGDIDNPIVLDDLPEISEDRKRSLRTKNMVAHAIKKVSKKRLTERAEIMHAMKKKPTSQLWSDEEKTIFKKCFMEGNRWLKTHLRPRQVPYTFDASKFAKLMTNYNYKNLRKAIRKSPRNPYY